MRFSSKWNYLACYFSVFACVVCALAHDLPFLLINFFFAVWNWYIAEWKRGKENEQEHDRNEDEEEK